MAKKIVYNGDSKIIKRICEAINDIIDNGSGESPLYYDSEGHICIDYDKMEVK